MARLRRDLIVAGHQHITQERWADRRAAFEVFVSQVVLEEARAGDQEAARQRFGILAGLPLLEITEEATVLAKDLIRIGPLPERAENRCKLFAFLQPQYHAKQPIHFCLQL
jgi:hypothetical protein